VSILQSKSEIVKKMEKEKFDLSKMTDYTGRKLGYLTYIKPVRRNLKWRCTMWLVRCDCGREVILIPGKSKGCGADCGIFPSKGAGIGLRNPYRIRSLIKELEKENSTKGAKPK
jgi:hypothetical protein